MENIASFQVDHTRLEKGLYISRKDSQKNASTTTFDLRMKKPNNGDYLSSSEMHTIEHIGATYLRNREDIKASVIYFGPMGCRTGFYLVLFGDWGSFEINPILIDMFSYIASFEGHIFGATEKECGNYKDQDLAGAKRQAESYLGTLLSLSEATSTYPV